MRYFSMFSGIGGFELGIQRAIPGAECIGYSEINAPAIKVYEHQFKGHHNYGDATTIDAERLPGFDLICGGFPCQSFSIAGKRGGFNDTRGTLFFDVARIIKAKRPRLCVLENVKGLLSHDRGRTFDTIIRTLDELGYDIQWQVLNSKDFGVPQNRERVYIVGHLRGTPRPKVFPLYRDGAESIVQLNQPVHSNDRIYADSGLAPTLNTMQGGNRQPFVRIAEATKQGYAEATVGDTINISVPTSATRRGRVQKGLAGTLQTSESMVTVESDYRIRRLTPLECERLQGFPDNWTKWGGENKERWVNRGGDDERREEYGDEIISDSQRYKMCGNAVTVNVVSAVIGAIAPQKGTNE